MKTTPENVREFIMQGLPCEHVEVEGDGRHFQAVIVSSAFADMPLLQRHKQVYQALGERMEKIHALSMKTLTPDQWTHQQ